MNTTMKRVLCAALAVLLLVGLCGCGKDDKPKSPPVHRQDVTDYCLITEEISHYKVRVVNPYQKTVFEREELLTVPAVQALNDKEFSLHYSHPAVTSLSFAVVCNPESGYVSEVVNGALLVKNGYAVSLEYLTEQAVLMVRGLREGSTYVEGQVLEGCNPHNPNLTVKEEKDGSIKAHYTTPDGKKKTADVVIPE